MLRTWLDNRKWAGIINGSGFSRAVFAPDRRLWTFWKQVLIAPGSLYDLGHRSVETTRIYHEAALAMSEQAPEKTSPAAGKPGRYRPAEKLLRFLAGL